MHHYYITNDRITENISVPPSNFSHLPSLFYGLRTALVFIRFPALDLKLYQCLHFIFGALRFRLWMNIYIQNSLGNKLFNSHPYIALNSPFVFKILHLFSNLCSEISSGYLWTKIHESKYLVSVIFIIVAYLPYLKFDYISSNTRANVGNATG